MTEDIMENIDNTLEQNSYDTMRGMEAKHLISKAREASIPMHILGEITANSMCDHAVSVKDGNTREPSEMLKFIMDSRKKWAYKGCFIVIDGGSRPHRDWIAQLFLYRGIVSHARSPGRLAATVTMSDIISLFMGLPSNKMLVSERLSYVPCLFIKDVNPQIGFKRGSDGKVLFDSVLNNREMYNRPTIITIDGVVDELRVPQEDDFGKKWDISERYGRKFAEIIEVEIDKEDNSWRFRAAK
jgi:hypothetical protein